MGAGVSSIMGLIGDAGRRKTGLGDLPEDCVALVLTHLDPVEICRVARLSRTFRGAASANLVWETKVPRNYRYLLALASEEYNGSLLWKEIYARLCRPIPLNGGTQEFWLEKTSGQICMSISSKALMIAGVNDHRYWKHIPTNESRFGIVPYLEQTWWFEVIGEIDFCFPAGTYSLFFRFHLGRPYRRLGRRICTSKHIHGWEIKPIKFQLSTSYGQLTRSKCYLDKPGRWILYHAGDFVVDDSDELMNLKFSAKQVDCTHTKGGLCVDSVLICPKEFRPGRVCICDKIAE
ncbi:hypothetical protein Cni_G08825 [Canna indica]|uniref:F-box domain-containing protein n=1 Tax=Canna indica TaxID=4628 RepID=A0AAQ3K163_9LILI|nr:hypothetical protein Cni_G08825 [Canna indica]